MDATLVLALGLGEADHREESLSDRQAAIKELPIRVECRVIDQDGAVIADTQKCNARWNVAVSAQATELWHEDLRDIRIRRNRTYRLELKSKASPDLPENLTLTPILRGGGSETP